MDWLAPRRSRYDHIRFSRLRSDQGRASRKLVFCVLPLLAFVSCSGTADVGNDVVDSSSPPANSDDTMIPSDDAAIPSNETTLLSYTDVASRVGLVLAHDIPSDQGKIPFGSGSAWTDYDGDQDIDLFVTNLAGPNRLYQNTGDTNGDGLPDFVDVAAQFGVDDPGGLSHGAVFIDYDNDGDQDLFVTNRGGNKLYRNQLVPSGSVSFVDVTSVAGLGATGRAVTAAWADFDGDGFLDVYLAKTADLPEDLNNQDQLFHSEGDGTFTDVTDWLCSQEGAPCTNVMGLSFSAGWLDYDDDGDLDLYLVNDDVQGRFVPNVLWRNDGSGDSRWLFTDVSVPSQTNLSVNGMGLGIGDFDNDGWQDLAFSNIGPNHLLRNLGDATFADVSESASVQRATLPSGDRSVTWGTAFFDYDNDAWLDLLIVAGGFSMEWPTPNAFFKNNADGKTFTDISAGSGLDDARRSISASIADFDGDGWVDVFVGNLGDAPGLFHNQSVQQGNTNHWLTVTVEGTDSNRDGIGTRLWLTTPDGVTQMREITSGATYGGGDYRAAYFGFGANTSGALVVRWPSGLMQNIDIDSVDRQLKLVEGEASGSAVGAALPSQLTR